MECQCLVEKVDRNQEMADEGARKEDTMRALHQQFSNLNMEVSRMRKSLDELEAACKWVVQPGWLKVTAWLFETKLMLLLWLSYSLHTMFDMKPTISLHRRSRSYLLGQSDVTW